MIYDQSPILLTEALLSTYFDNPCGELCDELIPDYDKNDTTTASTLDSTTDSRTYMMSVNDTANDTVLEGLQGLQDLEQTNNISTSSDFKDYQVFLDRHNQTTDIITPEVGDDGSGSGNDGLDFNVSTNQSTIVSLNDSLSQQQNSTQKANASQEDSGSMFVELPWNIFSFFNNKYNRSDDDIYREINNASSPELSKNEIINVENKTESTTILTASTATILPIIINEVNNINTTQSNETTTPSILAVPTTTAKQIFISIYSSKANCTNFNRTICSNWSEQLQARLCCLGMFEKVVDDGGFGCNNYNKTKCNQILPNLKCCLDFSRYKTISRT
jgi:hypothetical protein